MRKLKVCLTAGMLSVIIGITAFAQYNQESGVYTLDYTSTASADMQVNLVCLKPGVVPAQIEIGNSDDYIEFSDIFNVAAKEKAICSFSVKENSPEGIYNVWIYTEQHGTISAPYDSFYFIGSEGLTAMFESFNAETADIAALIEEYSQNKPVLKIEKTDYYNENTASVTAIIKAQAPFSNCADIEKAYKTALQLDKINKLTADNCENAESIIDEFMQENGMEQSEIFKKYKNAVIKTFIADKSRYESVETASRDLQTVSVLTIINSVTQNSEMVNVVKEYAKFLAVDYSDYEACNKTNANKYIMNKSFTNIEDLKKALNEGIKESPKGGTGGSTSKGSGSSGGGFSIGGSAPAIVNKDAFNDMNNHVWAREAVEALMKKGIVSGDGNGLFRPSDSITREEFLKMVIEAFGLTGYKADISFKDAVSGAWYEKYISAACALNITNGRNSEIFGIGEKVTREEMAVFVQRAAKAKGLELVSSGENAFADSGDISGYARSAVNSLSQKGIINGMGENLFMPKENSTRAQAAVIIYRAMNFWEG